MNNQTKISICIYLTLLLTHHTTRSANAGKIHIPDDLDDVIDNEEDDDWINWGKKKPAPSPPQPDLKPSDLNNMDPSQIQAQLLKHNQNHHTGPVFGFVKLTLGGTPRTPDAVSKIAMKWSKVAKTGGVEVKFMGVDISTIMFTMEAAQDVDELKEFILEQPDAYEVKIGDNIYRRPGDPPLDEVMEKLRSKANKGSGAGATHEEHDKDEL